MRRSIHKAWLVAFVALVPAPSFAAAASSYICAVNEVYECLGVEGCKRVTLKDINLAPIMTLDAEKKELRSSAIGLPPQTEDIEGFVVTEKAILLHGTQDEETWNATVSLADGSLTGGITSGTSSFALFGTCAPK
jgi:hypothetical protein